MGPMRHRIAVERRRRAWHLTWGDVGASRMTIGDGRRQDRPHATTAPRVRVLQSGVLHAIG